MVQVIVFARDNALFGRREAISDIVHAAEVAHLDVPEGRRFHRFVPTTADDVYTPSDRSSEYVLIQVLMMQGRSVAAKKAFYAAVYEGFHAALGTRREDLEIAVVETPKHDWSVGGVAGDELGAPPPTPAS